MPLHFHGRFAATNVCCRRYYAKPAVLSRFQLFTGFRFQAKLIFNSVLISTFQQCRANYFTLCDNFISLRIVRIIVFNNPMCLYFSAPCLRSLMVRMYSLFKIGHFFAEIATINLHGKNG